MKISAICVAVVLTASSGVSAETIVVTSAADDGPGSLRRAVYDARDDDEIRFHPTLDGVPIVLSRGAIAVDKSLTITGRGPERTIIDAQGLSPALRLECCFHAVTLSGMTVRNGFTQWIGGCVVNEQYTFLTINDTVVSDCSGFYGGGVYNGGRLTMSNSLVQDNTATYGGGIYNTGALQVFNSTLHANAATSGGGGLFNDGSIWLSNVTVHGNSAAGSGGALFNWNGSAYVTSTTVAGNTAFDGGGIAAAQGAIYLRRTIVAKHPLGGDCATAVISRGHNLDMDDSCGLDDPTDQAGVDPMLEPLHANGGPTPTCALRHGSPALEAGGSECEPLDQRGEPRPRDGDADGTPMCDLGAYELRRPMEVVPQDSQPGDGSASQGHH